jgi:hypothetical protein
MRIGQQVCQSRAHNAPIILRTLLQVCPTPGKLQREGEGARGIAMASISRSILVYALIRLRWGPALRDFLYQLFRVSLQHLFSRMFTASSEAF